MGKMGEFAKKIVANITEPVKIELCRGSMLGCPKAVVDPKDVEVEILDLMENEGLVEELKEHLPGENVFQPTLRISISGCVNGCSRPHIKDIGIEGVVDLKYHTDNCDQCGACFNACQENAIKMTDDGISIDHDLCLSCGECANACSKEALTISKPGIRVMIGGRLGRHPHLAEPLAKYLSNHEGIKRIRQIFREVIRKHRSGQVATKTIDNYGKQLAAD